MKRLSTLALLAFAAATASAQVTVSEPWVRGTVAQQKASGAFMKIQAEQDVRLVSATSPVAGVVEIHEMAMDGNVMKMRELPAGLPIAKGATTELKPGGYHVMLMDLKQTLAAGQNVPITLTFEKAADKQRFTQQIEAPVRALGAKDKGAHDHGAGHHHKH